MQLAEKMIRNVVAMSKSATNAVIFKDDPWLWWQYYTGLSFKRPTFIIMLEKDKKFAKLFTDPLVKKIYFLKEWDETKIDEVAEEISKFVKLNK